MVCLCTHLVSEVGVVTVEWLLVVAEDTGIHASRRASGTRRDMEASSETSPEKKKRHFTSEPSGGDALAASDTSSQLECPTRPVQLADELMPLLG